MKLYTELINRALKIAYDAHHGQTDKSGMPYIYHPAYLASQMDTEDEIITAILHDVVEDTPVTFDYLKREGFPPSVLDALQLLTHKDGCDYVLYIMGLAINPLAVKVKLADLRHNADTTRNANLPPDEAARRKEKYREAIQLLEECVAERAEMLRKAENGDPGAMFLVGIEYYWGHGVPRNRRKAFELLSRAMENGLPKDREYVSDDNSELNAARFLAPMLLRDDDGVLSKGDEPFWFEKAPEPGEDTHKVSADIREIFLHITGRGGVERDLEKAAGIAQSIVLELSFGDRDHGPAITLRSILQKAASEGKNGIVKLSGW